MEFELRFDRNIPLPQNDWAARFGTCEITSRRAGIVGRAAATLFRTLVEAGIITITHNQSPDSASGHWARGPMMVVEPSRWEYDPFSGHVFVPEKRVAGPLVWMPHSDTTKS